MTAMRQSALAELAGETDTSPPGAASRAQWPAAGQPATNGKLVARARAYVATVDPAVSGQAGHAVTWRIARKLAQDFQLDAEQTFSILWNDYNPRCQPPWSERELRHKAREAVEKARVANPVDEQEHWRMPDTHDSHSHAPQGNAPGAASVEPAWLSVAGIFEPLEPMRWLVQALDVAAGAPVLLAGYGFSGKTVAAQSLAVSIAAGQPAWGSLAVRRGSVRHFDFEQGARLTRERYQRLALALGVSPADLEGRLALWPLPRFTFDSTGAEDTLCRWLEGVDLAIIDSFRAACPSIDENSSEARLPLDMLSRVSERTGCVPLVIHHARKPSQNATGGAKMAIRGSGALFDDCSSVLCFEGVKGAPTRVTHEKARNTGRPTGDFTLRIADAEGGGLTVLAEHGGSSSPDGRIEAMKGRIIAHLAEAGSAAGKGALRERLAVDRSLCFAALAELESEGTVASVGTYKQPKLVLKGERKS